MPAAREGEIIVELIRSPHEVRGVFVAALERCDAAADADLRGQFSGNGAERSVACRWVQGRRTLIVLYRVQIDSKPQAVQGGGTERVSFLDRRCAPGGAIAKLNIAEVVGRTVRRVVVCDGGKQSISASKF